MTTNPTQLAASAPSYPTQLAAIKLALQHFKDKIPHHEWSDTPLPVIAAPMSWLRGLAASMGQPDDILPAQIHGCSVVRKDEINEPVLITHDGKAYKVSSFIAPPTEH